VFAEILAAGSKAANKGAYSATLICGSTTAGDPLPPHFQLTSVVTGDWQHINIDFIANDKIVKGHWGFPTDTTHPSTWGMNEKAERSRTREVYLHENLLLYPDLADYHGKCIILKCDTGTGQMNIQMLLKLRACGVYLIPGVLNTTYVSQGMDLNYSLFRSDFYQNLAKLTKFCYAHNDILTMMNVPTLVFGATEGYHDNNAGLVDAFQKGYNKEKNKECWKVVKTVPLTCTVLASSHVFQEIAVTDEGAINMDTDSMGMLLMTLQNHNHLCCDILSTEGCDENQFCLDVPVQGFE